MIKSPSKMIDGATEKINEAKKSHCFQKWDNPLGISQHVVNLLWIVGAHLISLPFFIGQFRGPVPLNAILFATWYGHIGGLGTTVGCHRYWTHKSFKAKFPLQVLLMIMQTISGQYPIYKWCLDHRLHHKYTDTNADPHNSKKGFWYSHIGWLFLPKHKELQDKINTFDMRDLEIDPLVRFQSRWYEILLIVFGIVIPTSAFYFVWNMCLVDCFILNCARYVISLHVSGCINSVGHMWGDRPYDKHLSAVDHTPLACVALGEGFHNYHHKFPFDYRASEFGWKFNSSTLFIDMFAKIGWAYDLKTVSKEAIVKEVSKSGLSNGNGNAKSSFGKIKEEATEYNFQSLSSLPCRRELD